jgi:hypothetical protein
MTVIARLLTGDQVFQGVDDNRKTLEYWGTRFRG